MDETMAIRIRLDIDGGYVFVQDSAVLRQWFKGPKKLEEEFIYLFFLV